MHDLYTSVYLRVKHCLIRDAHYASNISADAFPEKRGKTNTVTLNRAEQHIRSSMGPASSLPEIEEGEKRGVRRHVLQSHPLSISYERGDWD